MEDLGSHNRQRDAVWANMIRTNLVVRGTAVPDDATPDELQALLHSDPFLRNTVSRPIWARFWVRERKGGQLPQELRDIVAAQSPTLRTEQERSISKARRIRQLLTTWKVPVSDECATLVDLDFLLEQHRPLQRLSSSRQLMQRHWGIRLPDDATSEEHGMALERLGPPRIPKLLFWRRLWPKMRRDLLQEVRTSGNKEA